MVDEFKLEKKHIIYFLLAVVVLLAVLPWLKQGIAYTDDFRDHVAHFWHMKNSLTETGSVIFWMPHLYSGWPIFHFYSLFPYFISIPFILLFNTITALKASMILSFIVAAISMFVGSRILFKKDEIAFISSVAYTFFTYHFIDAGIRGAFNELWGYSLFPLVLALAINAIREPNRKNTIFAIIATSIIMLTHVPTAYMFWLCFGLYLIYDIFVEKKINLKTIKNFLLIGIWTLGLISFWLIPFVTESGKASFGHEFYDDAGNPKLFGMGGLDSANGMNPSIMFLRETGTHSSGERYIYLGFSLLTLLGFSLLYKNKISRYFAFLAIFIIVCIVTPGILDLFPLIALIHFKFRLFLIIGAALSFVAGISAFALLNSIKKNENIKFIFLILIASIIVIDFYPANKFVWTNQKDEYFINDPAQVDLLTRISSEPGYFLVFSPLAQMAYAYHGKFEMGYDWEGFREGVVGGIQSNYTETAFAYIDGIKTGNLSKVDLISQKLGYFGVKYIVLPCLNGFNLHKVSYTNEAYCAYENQHYSPLIIVINATIEKEIFKMNKIIFDYSSTINSQALIKISYFEDHWKAFVDNNEVKISSTYPKYMLIDVPKGNHRVELRYVDTKTQIITKILSLLAFILLICYYFELDKKISDKK